MPIVCSKNHGQTQCHVVVMKNTFFFFFEHSAIFIRRRCDPNDVNFKFRKVVDRVYEKSVIFFLKHFFTICFLFSSLNIRNGRGWRHNTSLIVFLDEKKSLFLHLQWKRLLNE